MNKDKVFHFFKKYSYLILLIYLTAIYRLTAEWHFYSKNSFINMTTLWDQKMEEYVDYNGIFVYIYLSYFIFLMIPFFLRIEERLKMTIRLFVMSSMAHVFFIIKPTCISRFPEVFFNSMSLDKILLKLIYHYDLNLNCFPTLHAAHVLLVAFSFYTKNNNRKSIPLIIWAILIAISTVNIRQHSLADLGGAILIVGMTLLLESKSKRFMKT